MLKFYLSEVCLFLRVAQGKVALFLNTPNKGSLIKVLTHQYRVIEGMTSCRLRQRCWNEMVKMLE